MGFNFQKIYRVYSFNLSRFSPEFIFFATIYFVSFSWIAAHCANRGRWRRSRSMGHIAAGDADSGQTWGGIRARMAIDGEESNLAEHGRSADRPADYSRTINIVSPSVLSQR
jgi:hypothetical protein